MNKKIQIVIDILNKINAKDIKIYETKDVTPFFEYLIIATALTNRQMNSLASYLKEAAEINNFNINGIEGATSNEWVLADLEDVIVNVFTKEARDLYDLDRLYKNLNEIEIK